MYLECPPCVFSGFPATAYGPVAAAAVAAARGSGRGTRGRGGGYTAYGQNAGAGKCSVCILCGLMLSPSVSNKCFTLHVKYFKMTHPNLMLTSIMAVKLCNQNQYISVRNFFSVEEINRLFVLTSRIQRIYS